MKAVIQRVSSASVKIGNQIISRIGRGLVVLLGIPEKDTRQDIEAVVNKINNLRIFEDDRGRMNISIKDIDAQILIVSQFTLLADLGKGRRPSFIDAASPEKAENIYNDVIGYFRKEGIRVESGKFREDMQVELVNDGPVTFVFDTNKKC